MRLAVTQTPGSRLEEWHDTLSLIADLISRAAGLGAELVVFPECVWPAYCFGSKQAYFAARRASLPGSDAFLEHIAEHARRHRIAICAGYVEETGERLNNTACLVDAGGTLLGTHRKCFLWDFDHDYFEPGQTIEPLETPWGCVGLMVCADARLPEIPATLAARGASLILQPTAWVNAGGPDELWNPQPDFLISARAQEFGVPIASASKWGREGTTRFVGSSLICDAAGAVLARCGGRETAVVAADVALGVPRGPVLTEFERLRLMSLNEPVRPRADVGPLQVTPLPLDPDERGMASCPARTEVARPPMLALGYRIHQSPLAANSLSLRGRLAILTGPTADPFEVAGIRIATANAVDAGRFGATRCLALDGVHAVVLFGEAVPTSLLRTRACENRIFVLAASPGGWSVADPQGRLIGPCAWPAALPIAPTTTLDMAVAANKNVASQTDVVMGRRPMQYAF